MTDTWKLEFPYRRSVGPVIGEFLTALSDGRVVGARTPSGTVLVPPLEYDPTTAQAVTETVEVAPSGELVAAVWVTDPMPQHPLDEPFAWALVRLDGADTTMLHALAADGPEAFAPGDRVRARWRPNRVGHITDIECFEVVR